MVALGADDRSVSIWQTKFARPLIVAKEVFERQIMDLSWQVNYLFEVIVSEFLFSGPETDLRYTLLLPMELSQSSTLILMS